MRTVRFYKCEDIDKLRHAGFGDRLRRYSFRAIDPARGERQAAGWVDPLAPCDFIGADVSLLDGSYLFLGFRRDRKAPNRIMLRERIKNEMARVKRESGVARLSRQQRVAIEEQETVKLLAETSATTAVTEVVLNTNTGTLLIGAASRALCERIVDFIVETFDIRPKWQHPALLFDSKLLEEVRATTALEAMDNHARVGPEFLTWLHQRQETGRCTPDIPTAIGLQIEIHDPVRFEAEVGDARSVVLAGEDALYSPEANEALRLGKLLTGAKLQFEDMDWRYNFTLDAWTFDLRGLRLPVPKMPDVREQRLQEVQSIEMLHTIMLELFDVFFRERRGWLAWRQEQTGIPAGVEA